MTLLQEETPAAAPPPTGAPAPIDVAALSRTLTDVTSRLAADQRHAVADVLQSLAEALRGRR